MVLASTSEIAINPSLYSKLSYDTVKDLAAVAMVASTPMVVIIHPTFPVATMKDLIALAKAKPGAINVASAGTGTRADALPQIPTVIESGVPGYEVEYWYGLFAPAATPRDALARLVDEIAASLKLPDMVTNLANQGATPGRLTQAQFADFVKAEVVKWGGVVKSSGARAD